MKSTDVFLREKGIKPSYQRKRIYEYLIDNRIHPTVNEVYNDLIKDIPVLSKATVYNTMKLFREKDLIDVIPIEGNEARFDLKDQRPHGHFKCDVCGNVFDVTLDIEPEEMMKDLSGFKVKEQNLNFRGICKYCNSKEGEKIG